MKETLLGLCVAVIAIELVSRFCGKEEMLSFVRSLVILLLLLSCVASLLRMDLDFRLSGVGLQENGGLSEYVEDQYQAVAQAELEKSLEALLATIQVKAKKITINTDINEESSIELTKVTADFLYETDAQRGKALLSSVLGEDVNVEVTVHGR